MMMSMAMVELGCVISVPSWRASLEVLYLTFIANCVLFGHLTSLAVCVLTLPSWLASLAALSITVMTTHLHTCTDPGFASPLALIKG